MSWWVARPPDNELFEPHRRPAELGAVLGASAVALVVLGVLAALAAEGLESFGGSVSVLAGLLCGAALVVAGLAGVARRHLGRLPDTGSSDETLRPRPSGRSIPPDRQRADETRIMQTVAAGASPPPPPTPRGAHHVARR